MKELYYLVSGLDDGIEIEPYVIAVTNDEADYTLEAHCGDFRNPRYFDPITKDEYNKMMKKKGRAKNEI